jgi:hypothetical protein
MHLRMFPRGNNSDRRACRVELRSHLCIETEA